MMSHKHGNPLLLVFGVLALIAGITFFSGLSSRPAADWGTTVYGNAAANTQARRILFLGNSHSHSLNHDVPGMVYDMLKKADSGKEYHIVLYARPGYYLGQHWQDPKVQELLRQRWDAVVLQGNGKETLYPKWNRAFQTAGKALAQAARRSGAEVWLYVTWEYQDGTILYQEDPSMRTKMHSAVQRGYGQLAMDTGAKLVNVGEAVKRLKAARPGFPVYEADGYHGSLQTHYLAALLFFRQISGKSPDDVRYAPSGISSEEAALLKKVAG